MEKSKEDKFKESMFEAIGMIGTKEKQLTPSQQILRKLEDRMKYIRNKLSSCMGYSEEEKKIRYDEILNAMQVVEEVLSE